MVIAGRAVIHGDLAAAQTTRSIIRIRARDNGAGPGTTTNANEPINDCLRSKKIIDFITQQFVGAARTRWLSAPENTKPRCLENHRCEGQAAVADGEYGFYG